MRDSTEVLELLRPIRVWSDRIVPDTEGAGRFRGAPSLYIEYGPVATELEVLYAADGTVNPALGARGGSSGALTRPYMRAVDGQLRELEAWARVVLAPGETIISISTGGGGYGPAIEREVERVRNDVLEGWISSARARAVYGVVLSEGGEIDEAATSALRRELAATDADASGNGSTPAARDPVLELIEPGKTPWPTVV